MEQLTIKELAPYLPYRLKAKMLRYKSDYVGNEIDTILGIDQWDKSGELWSCITLGGSKPSLSDIKPILRNISDLIKEIEVNGEKFVPIMVLFGGKDYAKYPYRIDVIDKLILGKYINIIVEDVGDITFQLSRILNNRLNYEDWQYLISLHFDIFNLIPRNLAIDIKTIK
jgi:hypothetical protein